MTHDNLLTFSVYDIVETPEQPILIEAEKEYLIFIHSDHYSKSEKELITKILSAIHLNEEEVQLIVQDESNNLILSSLRSRDESCCVILFGISPLQIGLNIEKTLYKWNYLGNWRVLSAHNLSQLGANINAKKALWNALKQFNS